MNQRDGTFKNAGPPSGAVNADGRPEASRGVDADDFDGDDDLIVTELPSEGPTLYVNDGQDFSKT
jgi:hypothetical protein